MKHLSREELIDSLEHTLPPAREAHVESCTSCRAERNSLQQVLGRVKAVDVPEPSPLFWTHFSTRVREQVAQEPRPTPSAWPAWLTGTGSGWTAWSWPKWAVGAATLVLCVALGWTGWRGYARGHLAGTRTDSPAAARTAPYATADGVATVPDDDDWNLVVSLAEDVSIEDSDDAAADGAAMVVRPGAADRVMADLSPEQRSELARILTAEMGRPAS